MTTPVNTQLTSPTKSKLNLSVLGIPPIAWFLFFLVGPLGMVLMTSFLQRGTYGGIDYELTFNNYIRAFDPIYLDIYLRSFKLAALNTLICLFLGYPTAWAISTVSYSIRQFYILLLSIPFLMNLVIRIYSLKIFVSYDGPLLSLLSWLGIPHDPFAFSQNQFLVLIGMASSYLPFMIFPLYAALEKFDYSLLEANYDLGGGHWSALTKVLIPNTRQAIATGILLVFIPSMGEFVIPDLLGGAKNMLAGNLITEQFLKARDWPFGAALTVIFVTSLLFFSVLVTKWGNRRGT